MISCSIFLGSCFFLRIRNLSLSPFSSFFLFLSWSRLSQLFERRRNKRQSKRRERNVHSWKTNYVHEHRKPAATTETKNILILYQSKQRMEKINKIRFFCKFNLLGNGWEFYRCLQHSQTKSVFNLERTHSPYIELPR